MGSWSRAILKYIPDGVLCAVDFQNTEKWLKPSKYGGRLKCHKINDLSDYSELFKDEYFDLCVSFGVLCHYNKDHIKKLLEAVFPKLRKGSHSVHQYIRIGISWILCNWPKSMVPQKSSGI